MEPTLIGRIGGYYILKSIKYYYLTEKKFMACNF